MAAAATMCIATSVAFVDPAVCERLRGAAKLSNSAGTLAIWNARTPLRVNLTSNPKMMVARIAANRSADTTTLIGRTDAG